MRAQLLAGVTVHVNAGAEAAVCVCNILHTLYIVCDIFTYILYIYISLDKVTDVTELTRHTHDLAALRPDSSTLRG